MAEHQSGIAEQTRTRNTLDKAIERLGDHLSLIFIFIVAISTYEVFMRYALNAPTIWVQESAAFLGGSLFIFGGAYALATDKHVRVVLIYDAVSEKTRLCLRVFHHIMGLVFSVMMIWASYLIARDAWLVPTGAIRLETSGTAWNPPYPAYLKAIMVMVMVTLSIQFLWHLIADVKKIIAKA